MIASLKSYPRVKDSGMEWLGKIPAHWKVRKLKHWLTVNRQVLSEDTDPDYTFDYVDISSVGTGRLVTTPERLRFRDCPSRARRVVQSGDTIMSTVRTYLKAVWYADNVRSDLVASTGFAVLSPKSSTWAKFVSYLCLSEHFTNRVTANSVGIAYPAIAETKLEAFKVGVPPLSEQTAIARFLDHATDQIERYIRTKEKFIALLEEQKQVMIHDAVTGQIDVRTGQPYPTYKPSGVEWLEEVPAHWKVVPLKRIGKFQSGSGFPVAIQGDTEQEILFMKVSDMNSVGNEIEISHAANTVSSEVALQLGAQVFEHNTIVFPKVGGALLTNKRRLLARSTCIDNNLMACVVTGAKLDYVFLLLVWLNLGRMAQPGPVPAINEGEVREIRVALPPSPEQITIARFLNNIITNRAEAIERANREVDLLREYRSRLIADVVTGKLDVREAAANLPELEAIADGGDETIAAEPDSQQSNTTLHPSTTPGVGS